MTDQDLIKQLKGLKKIQPRKDWVVLTKSQILTEEQRLDLPLFSWRLAFAPLISVLIVIGLFGFVHNTMPGDFLFSVKKMTESVQVGLTSTVEKPGVHLKLANKRLEELNNIAEANQGKDLGPAIEEFQANVAEATKGLVAMDIHVTSSDPIVLKEIVEETQKLAENKEKLETALGTIVGDTEGLKNALNNLEKRTAGYLIADLESRILTEEDQKLLEEAKEAYEAKNYSLALEKIWLLSNKPR